MLTRTLVTRRKHERGIALVVALLVMLTLTLIGAGLTVATRAGTRVGTGLKLQQVSFEGAETGLDRGKEVFRIAIFDQIIGGGGDTFDTLLGNATGVDNLLVDSTTLESFEDGAGTMSNGFVQVGFDDVPLMGSTAIADSNFQVFVSNDPAEGVTNPDDTNEIFTLTALASGSNEVGFSALQGTYQPFPLPPIPDIPGLINLPGPMVNFDGITSNAALLDGNYASDDPPACYPTIAVTTESAHQAVIDNLNAGGSKPNKYVSCDPAQLPNNVGWSGIPTTDNILTNDPANPTNPYEPGVANTAVYVNSTQEDILNLMRVSYLNQLVADLITTVQDNPGSGYVGTAGGQGFTVGSLLDPKISIIQGDLDLAGNGVGAGILVVDGTLTVAGNYTYHGLIMAIGDGVMVRHGGGNGDICGTVFIANVNTGLVNSLGDTWVGPPSYTHDGGGVSNQAARCDEFGDGDLVKYASPFQLLSFQQLRIAP